MKVQTRPFVVEVRKRRGAIGPKPSIWAGTDLATAARQVTSLEAPGQNEVSAVEDVSGEALTITDKDASSEPDVDVTTDGVGEARSGEVAVTDDDVVPVAAEVTDVPVRRPQRRSRSKAVAASLPRGQRWKRRLPEVLRRKKRPA